MKILITGDRNWTDIGYIEDALLDHIPHNEDMVTLVHGAAKGADFLAAKVMQAWIDEDEANSQVYLDTIKAYPADWKKYGKAAGPIRNQQMLDENPDIDLVLAFHDNLEESKGTKDMVARAKKAGIPVVLVSHKN